MFTLVLRLMEEILHQLIGSLSHYLQGFIHLWWCRISAINSSSGICDVRDLSSIGASFDSIKDHVPKIPLHVLICGSRCLLSQNTFFSPQIRYHHNTTTILSFFEVMMLKVLHPPCRAVNVPSMMPSPVPCPLTHSRRPPRSCGAQ